MCASAHLITLAKSTKDVVQLQYSYAEEDSGPGCAGIYTESVQCGLSWLSQCKIET